MKLSTTSKTQSLGLLFEKQAKQFLLSQNLQFIEANSHCKFGEIDLIMLDQNTLCFIEVRYRGNKSKSSALGSINKGKQRKIHQSSQHWLSRHSQYKHHFCRFDCVGIEPKQANEAKPNSFNDYHTINVNSVDYKLAWGKNAFM